jgi:hypothetical protein
LLALGGNVDLARLPKRREPAKAPEYFNARRSKFVPEGRREIRAAAFWRGTLQLFGTELSLRFGGCRQVRGLTSPVRFTGVPRRPEVRHVRPDPIAIRAIRMIAASLVAVAITIA